MEASLMENKGVNSTNMTAGLLFNDTAYDMAYYPLDGCVHGIITETPEFQAIVRMQTFYYPILLLLGTLGNLLSMVILRELSIHAWSSCLYLSVLCPIDLLVLYIKCGSIWIFNVFGVHPSDMLMQSSDAACKTMVFVTNLLIMTWPWLMVALSVELLIATRFPLKTYNMCTRERARATVLLITILLVCLNLHFFWTWGFINNIGCMYIEEFTQEFMNEIWPAILMTVTTVLPFVAVTVCFFISAFSFIRSSRKNQPDYEPILKRYFLDLQALNQLKHAALLLTLMFLIVKTFELSMSVLKLLDVKRVIVIPCEEQDQYVVSKTLADQLSQAFYYTFASIKFIVYFAFCARFRKMCFDFGRKLICCPRLKEKFVVSGGDASGQYQNDYSNREQTYMPVASVERNSGVAPHQVTPVQPAPQQPHLQKVTTKV